jgi:hypothetical protein
MLRPLLIGALLFSLTGCPGPREDTAEDGGTSDGGSVQASTGISGRRMQVHVQVDGGLLETAIDLSTTPIVAHVEEDSTYQAYPGTGAADGTFVIPAAPNARYLLQLGVPPNANYWELSGATVDLPLHGKTGRVDSIEGGDNTVLRLSLSGLDAWKAEDSMQLNAWNAGLGYWDSSVFGLDPAPTVASTSFTNRDTDWSFLPLIDGTKGDKVVVHQNAGATSATGLAYVAAKRATTVSNLTMVSGTTNPMSAALTALSQSSLTVDLRAADYTAHRAAAHPSAEAPRSTFIVDARIPTSSSAGYGTPDVLWVTIPQNAASGSHTFSYGNPFSGTELFGFYNAGFRVTYDVPNPAGGTLPYRAAGSLITMRSLSALAASPVQPALGMVGSPKLNGQDAFPDRTGVGLTPLVTWAAPTLGTPKHYEVAVSRLYVLTSVSAWAEKLTTLVIRGTQVRIPAGVLQAGQTYYLAITAKRYDGPYDPFGQMHIPSDESTVLTGKLTP